MTKWDAGLRWQRPGQTKSLSLGGGDVTFDGANFADRVLLPGGVGMLARILGNSFAAATGDANLLNPRPGATYRSATPMTDFRDAPTGTYGLSAQWTAPLPACAAIAAARPGVCPDGKTHAYRRHSSRGNSGGGAQR
jgi:hypothetical protein